MTTSIKRKRREPGSSIVEVALLAPWILFRLGSNCSAGQFPLKRVTGTLFMGNGNTRVVPLGPGNPVVTNRAVLIQ